MKRFAFPKSARLTATTEFRRVKEAGETFQGKFMILSVLRLPADSPARAGFITSRRAGGAVQRNLIRRRLREIIRHVRANLQGGFWYVLIARHSAASASFAELREDCLRLLRRSRMLMPQ